MLRPSFFTALILAASITSTTTQACDTLAVGTITTLLFNSALSTRTIQGMRTKSEDMIDDYECNHGIFSMEELRLAYKIAKSTDAELANRLWWENTLSSLFVGIYTAAFYSMIAHPSKNCRPILFLAGYNNIWAAPLHR